MTFPKVWLIHIVLCVVEGSHVVRAQNTDSLLKVLNSHAANDTTKVKLYTVTAYAFEYVNPDSLRNLAGRGVALADKIQFDRGRADSRVALATWSLNTGVQQEQATAFCHEAIDIYGRTNDSAAMGDAFFVLAGIRYNQAKFDRALKNYLLAARTYEKAGNLRRTGISLGNAGLCYSTLSNYPEALKYFLQSLSLREKLKDTAGMATCLSNIAQVYGNLDLVEPAKNYIEQSVALQEKVGSDIVRMITYENAGGVYVNIHDHEKALVYFNKALKEAEAGGMVNELNSIRVSAAEMHVKLGHYDEAYNLYNKCLASQASDNNPAVEGMVRRGLGRIMVARGNVQAGISELLKASALFAENEMKSEFAENAHDLSDAYKKANDFRHALEYEEIYHAYTDSVHSREASLAHKLQYEYQLQEQQVRIRLLEKDNALAQTHEEKQRVVNLSLALGLVLLSVIVGLMLRSRRRAARSRQLIMDQAAKLHELNDFKNKIFSVLSHDLRGPIGSLSISLSMFDQEFITEKEFKELKPDLDQQLSAVTFLLENLLSWSKSHIDGGNTVKKAQADLHKLAAQSLNLMQSAAAQKNITINDEITSPTYAWCDKDKVDIIIRNLVSNAVKFTSPGGAITLSARTENNRVALAVADTGIGMSDEQIRALFSPQPGNTYGTAGEKGVGLGLLLSCEFAKAMGGDITVTSRVGEGSTFTLLLPEKN
jgi:signal transduction histidine kinase